MAAVRVARMKTTVENPFHFSLVGPMEKTCKGCLCAKPIADFYPHSAMADGHLNFCKMCVRARIKAHYETHREAKSAYEKKRNATEYRRRKRAIYQRGICTQKKKAWRDLNNGIRDGKIKRLPCRFCGNPRSQAHHDDYSKPLDVKWECFKCHREREHGQVVVSDYEGPTK